MELDETEMVELGIKNGPLSATIMRCDDICGGRARRRSEDMSE